MPHITFIKDATIDGEPSAGPHYRAGYCVDVPDRLAKHWIGKGVAVPGKVSVEKKPEQKPEPQEEKVEIPTFKRKRRV